MVGAIVAMINKGLDQSRAHLHRVVKVAATPSHTTIPSREQVHCVALGEATRRCELELLAYPHQTQRCPLGLGHTRLCRDATEHNPSKIARLDGVKRAVGAR